MNTSAVTKQWLGLPLNLVWGYIAIALFMTGDGFELAFLSHHITSLGFTAKAWSCSPSCPSPFNTGPQPWCWLVPQWMLSSACGWPGARRAWPMPQRLR